MMQDWMLLLLEAAKAGPEAGSDIVSTLVRPEGGNWRAVFSGWGGFAWTFALLLGLATGFVYLSRFLFPASKHVFADKKIGGYPGPFKPCDHGVNEIDLALLLLGGLVVYFMSGVFAGTVEASMYPESLKEALSAARKIENLELSTRAIADAFDSMTAEEAQGRLDARFLGMIVGGLIRASYAAIVIWHLCSSQRVRDSDRRAVATVGTDGLLAGVIRLPVLLVVWIPMAMAAMWFSLALTSLLMPSTMEPDYQFKTQGVLESLLQPSKWQVVAAIMTAVIAAPIWEEFFFRGVMQGFLRRYVPWWIGGVAPALVFTMMHEIESSPQILVPVLGLGLALSWIYERTGRLWLVVVLHAMHNGIVLLMASYFR